MSRESLNQYTWTEIQNHSTRRSLWIVFENKVYDITPFLTEHPGGEEVLLEQAAKDATVAFNDVGHSEDALEKRRTYLIGELEESEKREPPSFNRTDDPQKAINWWVPTGIIVLGLGIFFIIKYSQ